MEKAEEERKDGGKEKKTQAEMGIRRETTEEEDIKEDKERMERG